MVIDEIKKDAQKFFLNVGGCHDWSHVERVYEIAKNIGEKEGADLEVIKISAWLHDIAREEEMQANGGICHAERSAELSKEILEKHNIDSSKMNSILHCISSHRFKNNKVPESKEAKILYDADKLDSIGAVGIGRAFLFAGELKAKFHDKNVDIENTKPYTKEDTAYREFLVKLNKIKDKMLTSTGRKMAQNRHDFMVEYFERLNKETDGLL